MFLFGTSAFANFGVTPSELTPHKFWMFAPTTDRNEVARYLGDVIRATWPEVSAEQCKRLSESLFDYCGGNMSLVVATLLYVVEHKGKFPTTIQLVRAATPRVIVNGAETQTWEAPHRLLFKEILAVGDAQFSYARVDDAGKDLLRKGFVAPRRDYATASCLVHITDLTLQPQIPTSCQLTEVSVERVVAAHAWQRDFARCLGVTPHPVKLKKAPIRQPIDLLLRAVPLLDVNQLVASRIAGSETPTGGNTAASEYNFQAALLIGMSQSTPEVTILSEFLAHQARLDFFVCIEQQSWGMELVLNGHEKQKDFEERRTGPSVLSRWPVR